MKIGEPPMNFRRANLTRTETRDGVIRLGAGNMRGDVLFVDLDTLHNRIWEQETPLVERRAVWVDNPLTGCHGWFPYELLEIIV
jgi:hypothetical protein